MKSREDSVEDYENCRLEDILCNIAQSLGRIADLMAKDNGYVVVCKDETRYSDTVLRKWMSELKELNNEDIEEDEKE